jgi:hypothetical protein
MGEDRNTTSENPESCPTKQTGLGREDAMPVIEAHLIEGYGTEAKTRSPMR